MLAEPDILVIDAGTSALRALAVTPDGVVTPVGAHPWRIFTPEDAAPFGRELDGRDVSEGLARLVDTAAVGHRIGAIAVTGQREGIVFADGNGAAICVSPNIDARAAAEGIAGDALCGAEAYRKTGHLPSLMLAPAKLRWLRQHRPADAARVRRVVPLVDWLGLQLADASGMSRSLAAENGLLDVTSGEIASALLAQLDFDCELLPSLQADGWQAGTVTRGPLACRPVVLAGADTQCGLIGAGVVSPGGAGLVAGWSAPVQLVTAAALIDEQRRTWTGVHVAPSRYVLESNAGELGRAWRWYCDLAGIDDATGDALAADAPAGARDVTAVIGPAVMRAAQMTAGNGALVSPLPFVISDAGRADVLRAVLEAIAFSVRANLEQLEEISGNPIPRLCAGGGMTRSETFCQVLADVIDRPLRVASTPQTSALGAAMLAAVTLGLRLSLEDAIEHMCGTRRDVAPRLAAAAAYDDYYARWRALCEQMEQSAATA